MEQYKKNDIIVVSVEDMGADGEGIGKINGFPFFIKDALIGDTVEARVTKVKKNYAYARLEKVMTPSYFRTEPVCAFHRQCGGCQIQALDYREQLRFKQDKVRNNLIRIGGFEPALIDRIMEPIVGMQDCFHYRNKAQFPIGTDRDGNPVAGFYAGRTHSIIANTDCALGVKENRLILETILDYMRENHVSAYDETTGKGLVRHVLIRKGFATGELMVCVIINGTKLPAEEKLVSSLSRIGNMTSVSVNTNTENTNVIMGKKLRTLWGSDTITDRLGDVSFRISPLSFYQVNPVQTQKLYGLAVEYAGLTGQESVWDLYCGIGTISLFMARKAKCVYGVEVIPQAIEDAKQNAELNGITNAQFFVGKAEEVLPEFYDATEDMTGVSDGMRHPEVIVVDPPRKGCDEKCLETMLRMQPDRIVYVSCDSATLARDLKTLCAGGYELRRVRAVDQFPQTVHVESVILLSRKTPDAVININLDMSELDLTSAESKATYAEIKKYVLDKFGLKVSQLYIAQVKREFGLIERINYNVGEGKNHVPQVTPEKRGAIIDALKHFQMIE